MDEEIITDVVYDTINKYFFNGEYYSAEKIKEVLKKKYNMDVSLECINNRITKIISNV